MPSFDGRDDAVWTCGPLEGSRIDIVFGDEAVDGGLEIDDGVEHAALEPPFGESGEEILSRTLVLGGYH